VTVGPGVGSDGLSVRPFDVGLFGRRRRGSERRPAGGGRFDRFGEAVTQVVAEVTAERADGETQDHRHQQGHRIDRSETENCADDAVSNERPRDEDAQAREDGGDARLKYWSLFEGEAGNEPAGERADGRADGRDERQPRGRPDADGHDGDGEGNR